MDKKYFYKGIFYKAYSHPTDMDNMTQQTHGYKDIINICDIKRIEII